MKFFQRIFLRLLYLTPVGYFLSLLSLVKGESTPGVYVVLEKYSPIEALVKENPTAKERMDWLINGMVLLLGFWFVSISGIPAERNIIGDFAATYAWMSLVFGVVSTVSAFFPKFPWNKQLSQLFLQKAKI